MPRTSTLPRTPADDPYPTVWAALDDPTQREEDERYGCGWHESSQDLRRGLLVEEIPFIALASIWSAAFGGLSQAGRTGG